MDKRKTAIIEMLICATLWSIAGIFIKLLPWNGFAVASLRSIIAGLTIAVYMFIKKYRLLVNRKILLVAVLSGSTYLCFSVANKLTTAANTIVLQFMSPVFVLLYSAVFFGKKICRKDIVTVLLTLLGVTLCFVDGLKSGYLLGNFVAVAAGMFMAGMYVFIDNLDTEQRFSAAFLGQMFTAIVGFPWVIATKPVFTGMTILYILILGVFQLGISYILYVRASRYCPPLACCLLGVIEPLLNPVWVMLFDGEVPGITAFIGGIIVIATVTVWCVLEGREANHAES